MAASKSSAPISGSGNPPSATPASVARLETAVQVVYPDPESGRFTTEQFTQGYAPTYAYNWQFQEAPTIGVQALDPRGKTVAVVGLGRGDFSGQLNDLSRYLGGDAQSDSARSHTTNVHSNNIELTDDFKLALEILNRGDNLFLTGKAGTGKSTLIRHFIANSQKRVVVAAPTGIAALNVNGHTIHRLFSFGATTTLEHVESNRYYPARFIEVLKKLDTLIIDEASMVRADLLDMVETALRRFGPKPGQRFGGVQIVLVGDLFQLPPVVPEGEEAWIRERFGTPYFYSARAIAASSIPTIELTKIFRQQGDTQLTDILNAVREGVLTEDMVAQVNELVNPTFEVPDGEFWLTVAPTHRIVDARNKAELDKLPGQQFTRMAEISGEVQTSDLTASEILQYKVGAQVMLLNNDIAGRWVNGTIGVITDILDNGERVTVLTNDGRLVEVEPHTWEMTRPVIKGGSLGHDVVGTFTQLPFALAWAITIHKVQGQTLDRIVVDLAGGAFDTGQVYVALSRATSMNGLVLRREIRPKDLKTDPRIRQWLNQATTKTKPASCVAISVSTVGDASKFTGGPRPIEIGMVFEDGSGFSTLINPERDIANALTHYGISADDALVAPRLADAWPLLEHVLGGHTPVVAKGDQGLALLDEELRRQGIMRAFPLPIETAGALPDSPGALERARSIMRNLRNAQQHSGSPFGAPGELAPTYLLIREATRLPERSDTTNNLLETSLAISPILLGKSTTAVIEHEAVASVVAERLKAALATTAGLTQQLQQRIQATEKVLGFELLPTSSAARGVYSTLRRGMTVVFTGNVNGSRLSTDPAVLANAKQLGLVVDNSITASRTDVLVAADLSSQSRKVQGAIKWGIPVISYSDFTTWDGLSSPDAPLPKAEIRAINNTAKAEPKPKAPSPTKSAPHKAPPSGATDTGDEETVRLLKALLEMFGTQTEFTAKSVLELGLPEDAQPSLVLSAQAKSVALGQYLKKYANYRDSDGYYWYSPRTNGKKGAVYEIAVNSDAAN